MSYDVKPLHAPRLAGTALRLFTAAVETPGVGAPLRRAMLKAAGIPEFRLIASDDASIVVPPLPAAESHAPAESGSFSEGNAFAAAYRAGSTTPEAVAEQFLDAVAAGARCDPPLRAFIAVDAGDLRTQARAATLRDREGRPLGP